ncbi:MAG TPA: hypothetical protein VMH20_03935 [Verrucomicrobiae bacterium]|nr:hypothetical protein [Verrucomicrobiae bacterium]
MKNYASNFNYWLRLRNWYWVKTKPRAFLLEKVMTATENGLTRELANQLAKAARKKPVEHGIRAS